MANIRALAKGLLAGRRRGGAKSRIGGWVRVDPDQVIRGWAADAADPSRRLTVRLFIDLKPVAEAAADRFDARLLEQGHGDGRHAFACLIPQAFRDDRDHAYEAVVEEAGYRLMSREKSFRIAAASPAPRLALLEVTPTGLRARLKGGRAGDAQLELWSGGGRIDGLVTTRAGHGPQAELRLAYPRDVFLGLERDAAVAIPGMTEAGAGFARLFDEVRLRAEPADGGLKVWLDGPLEPGEESSEIMALGADGTELARRELRLGPAPATLSLPDGAVVAGVRVVASRFLIPGLEARLDGPAEDGPAANLIRNPDLNDWPHGVIVRGGPGRFELASGWHAQNRRSAGVVRAFPSPLDFDAEACSLTLAAAEVADYLRLEAEVESRSPLAGRGLELSFEAAIAQGPDGAFQSPEAFLLIDRIFLKPSEGRDGSVTIARDVVLTREMGRFGFRFEAPEDLRGEALVCFDFKRPTAVTLQRPQLSLVRAGGPDLASPAGFEDRGLQAQLGLTRGLEAWRSPGTVAPAAPDRGPGEARAPAEGPAVAEVVVCVHDAPDEVLACLASLAACTRLPHRVRLIDDASGEETRARISAFIADKPWMGLDPNPVHLGYTASADRGIRGAGADWAVLLNSDTVVTPGWLEGLFEAAGARPGVGMVGPLSNAASWQSVPDLFDRSGRFKVNEPPPGWTPARMAELIAARSERAFPEVPLLNGFCSLIRREAFLDAGGFNIAAFPTGYGEENDLCLRLAARGWKLLVADQVYVHHAKSASFGAERRTRLAAEGMAALKRLHPEADFAALGERMRETIPLIRMRDAVRRAIEDGG